MSFSRLHTLRPDRRRMLGGAVAITRWQMPARAEPGFTDVLAANVPPPRR
ncbi:MAG TPA: hypothetical protein VKP30_28265 [Polyangiaceae bacterium]|nr:hypothetical protein [Polyangiaceae bacterium]